MIDWFNSWAHGIILTVIVVTILELIVPNGKNKKYIKIVMGVYITFTIISPIISKVTGSNFELDVNKYQDLIRDNTTYANSIECNTNTKNIENLYLSTIKSNIKEVLEKEGYETKNVDITANINIKKEEANIYKINLELVKNKNNDIKKVNKIQIGNKEEESKENLLISESEIKDIKKLLSDKYEIEKEKICVNGK